MPPTRSEIFRKANKGNEQRKITASRKEALFNDISTSRQATVHSIDTIAAEHDKDKRYVSTQVHAGTKMLISKRKPSLYNAYLHYLSKKENNDGEGREKLPNLSSKMAETDWRAGLSKQDKVQLIHDLEKAKQDKEAKKKVTQAYITKDFNGTVEKLETEFVSLSQCTGAEYLIFFMRGGNLDAFDSQIFATPRAAEACGHLFAQTPEGMGLKIEGYCVAGLAGALQNSDLGDLNRVKAQKRIRMIISEGLTAILQQKGIPPQLHPAMQYSAHESLVVKTGVELVGWPDPSGIRSIKHINTAFELSRLLTALSTGECHWEILSDEDWKARKVAYQELGTLKRKTRSDKGVPRKGKNVKTPEFVNSDEDKSDSESEGAGAGMGAGEGENA